MLNFAAAWKYDVFNMERFIFTGILPLSALIVLKEKRKSGNELTQKWMQDSLGFYFEFNTMFLTPQPS